MVYFINYIYINKIHEPIGKTFASKRFDPIKLQGSGRKTPVHPTERLR